MKACLAKPPAAVGLVMTGGKLGASAVITTSSIKARFAVVSILRTVEAVPPVKLIVLVSNSPVMVAV